MFGNIQSHIRDWAVSTVADDVVTGLAANYTFPSWNLRSFLTGTYPLRERDLVGGPITIGLVPYGTAYFQFRVSSGGIASVRMSNAGAATKADVMLVRTK